MNPETSALPTPWLAPTRRLLPLLAGVVAGLLLVSVASNLGFASLYLALSDANLPELAEAMFVVSEAVWWALVATSCVVGAAVVAAWRYSTAQEQRGLRLAGLGLVLAWSGWLIDHMLVGWLVATYGQPELPGWLFWVVSVSVIAQLTLDLVAAGLLIAGAVRLRRVR